MLVYVFLFVVFIWILLQKTLKWRDSLASRKELKIAVILGSGGHTTEMLSMVKTLDPKTYADRCYFIAHTDIHSGKKVEELEKRIKYGKYEIFLMPRPREVRQGYYMAIGTTLRSLIQTVELVYGLKADVILSNGPGTCIPICAWAFVFKVLGYKNCLIVFVESVCRVKTMSLSGKLLYWFRIADRIIVQWSELKLMYPRAEYIGKL